jgi:hypothetical protein
LEILSLYPQGKFCFLLQLIFINLSIKRAAAEFPLQQKDLFSYYLLSTQHSVFAGISGPKESRTVVENLSQKNSPSQWNLFSSLPGRRGGDLV